MYIHPDLFGTILVPKLPELTALSTEDRGKNEARDHFETGFRKAFTAMQAKMDPRFPLTVYYAFKQEDNELNLAESEKHGVIGVDRTTGWETLLNALLGSGFQITATWPIRASQAWRMRAMGANALASYIVLACRPRFSDAQQCGRRDFVSTLKKELPNALKQLQHCNIAPVDLAQACIGPGMAVFSRYSKVIEADGSPMRVRTALQIINQELDAFLAEQEGEMDRDTRFCLAWFEQYGMNEGPFGEADVLARAKDTAVQGLVEAGVIHAKAGEVRLLKRKEMEIGWDPATDKRLTVWECTQHLIRKLDTEGEEAAARLLAKLGGSKSQESRDLAYRLFSICEKKKWPQEAIAYNSLVTAWPEITRLAQNLPTPPVQGGFDL